MNGQRFCSGTILYSKDCEGGLSLIWDRILHTFIPTKTRHSKIDTILHWFNPTKTTTIAPFLIQILSTFILLVNLDRVKKILRI